MLDAVDECGVVAPGKQQTHQTVIIIKHGRTAVTTLAHVAGHQLIGKTRNLAGTVLHIGRYIHLRDNTLGVPRGAPAFFDGHVELAARLTGNGADLQHLAAHLRVIQRARDGTVHQIGAGLRTHCLQARATAQHAGNSIQQRGGAATDTTVARGRRAAAASEVKGNKLQQIGDAVLRKFSAVINTGLQDGITQPRRVAVGEHIVVGQDHPLTVLFDQASEGTGGDVFVPDADATGRRALPLVCDCQARNTPV